MSLPSISPLSGGDRLAVSTPPFGFKPIIGPITEVKIGAEQIVMGRIDTSMSLAKIVGLKYEQEFLNYLRKTYELCLVRPHIHFRDAGAYRTVIPDAIIWDDHSYIIIEVKSQHMPEAWWQLNELYIPVLKTHFYHSRIRGLEVCKKYDPQMPWPGHFVIYNDLEDAIGGVSPLGVLRWRKQKGA